MECVQGMTSLMDALALGAIYALIAVGYTLVYGIIKLINFAHGEFFMGAAFAGHFVLYYVQTGHPALDFALAILAGATVASVLALTAERIAYRPLRRESSAAKRTAEVLAPLLTGLLILGYTPQGRAWAGILVAIGAATAVSIGCGRLIERLSWRSLTTAAVASGGIVAALTFACIALLPLRHGFWLSVGWIEEVPTEAGTVTAGSVLTGLLIAGAVGAVTVALGKVHLGRAGRIAGLLTALGVSLFFQALATRFWAEPRPCRDPFERHYVAIDEVTPGQAVRTLYASAGGALSGKEKILFAVEEEITTEALGVAREQGVRKVYTKSTSSSLRKQVLVLIVAVVATAGLTAVVRCTRYGRAIRALSQDADAARLVGVNPDSVIAFTFFLGAALAGLAGVLIGMYYNNVFPLMGYSYGIKAFIAAVVGGIGSVPGACLGGLLLGASERLFQDVFDQGPVKDVAAFALLIVILLVRPSGILGKREANRV